MEIKETGLPGLRLITPRRHEDDRGFFSEVYSRRSLVAFGIDVEFVQDNHSRSAAIGTIRGLHYQIPPMQQIKLVRVTRGAILDVVVDLRRSSPTFGRHAAIELSAAAWNQLFVPAGFAHGFCTKVPDTEVHYKVSNYYSPEHERGLRWDDAELRIAWPVTASDALLSARDRQHPRLADATELFA